MLICRYNEVDCFWVMVSVIPAKVVPHLSVNMAFKVSGEDMRQGLKPFRNFLRLRCYGYRQNRH